jgi:hypothetical protein
MEQTVVAASVTATLVQLSCPLAVKVVVSEQSAGGNVLLAVKLAEAPGARVATENTLVFALGRSLTTTTFFKMTLPAFRTVPV